jgi:hypothetical protein
VFICCSANAQTIEVSYIDGSASCWADGSWVEINAGDELHHESIVKLDVSSFLELRTPGGKLVVIQPGIYSIDTLLQQSRSAKKDSISAIVKKYRAVFFESSPASASVSFGVRGSGQEQDDDEGWVTTGTEYYIEAAKRYIAVGNYDNAIAQLGMALDVDSGDENEIEFYLAYCLSMKGDPGEAYRHLVSSNPAGTESWAPDYFLLKARLLVDCYAASSAIDLLVAMRDSLANDPDRSALFYCTLALAYKSAGDPKDMKLSIEKLRTITGNPDIGKEIEE